MEFDYNTLLNETIDAISMRQGFTSDPLEDTKPMSTGMLMLDLIYGGGIRPAWYTHYGREQSCKTTGALSILASAIKQDIPMIAFCDYEGSTKNSQPYVASILQTMGVNKTIKQVFGERDKETGEWITKPIVRYRAETIAEKFFDWLSEILRQLPDKKKVASKWWYIFEDNKVNKAKLGEYADKSMPKKYGPGLWIPAKDDKLQAIILLDSYPAMNPLDNDEQDANKTIALKARMFSAQIPRVKGRLASKMVAVIGINQLRAAPMAMYGPSEIEPCGEALKYSSDCRCKFTPRASGMPFSPTFDSESKMELEPSVTGEGQDKYRYLAIQATKNKLWTPNRKGWLRLWAEDAEGQGKGFDPVFDTACYLYYTGQLAYRGRKTMKLRFIHSSKEEPKIIPIKWEQIKRWVLGDREVMKQVCTELGIEKPFSLRRECFRQMENGLGEKLYVNTQQKKNASTDSEDEE